VLGVSRAAAVLNALDRLCGGYEKQADTAWQDLAIVEGQLRDYDSRPGQPFAHEAYLAELTSARDRLKAARSAAGPEQGAQPLPPAADIARHIKALKATHSIEAAPLRLAAPRGAAAEGTVTARIRRRTVLPAALEAAVEPEHAAPAAIAEPILLRIDAAPRAPSRPAPSYLDRVTRDKPRKARQMNLF